MLKRRGGGAVGGEGGGEEGVVQRVESLGERNRGVVEGDGLGEGVVHG